MGGDIGGDFVGDSRCTLQRYNYLVYLLIDHMAILIRVGDVVPLRFI